MPRNDPSFPQESPLPQTGRPTAGLEEENMVVGPGDISSAQEALRAKGLKPGSDGKLDQQTQEALVTFQKQNNLPATGVLDEKTAAKLGIALNQKN
jgi:Putative peptidoglycan binding domain.